MSEYTTSTEFIDLRSQLNDIRAGIDTAISNVLDHGHFIMGPEVTELETELSNYANCKHVITCANGTDALTCVLMSWGLQAGDVVFIPDFTYVATAESVAQLGATPFFIDIQKDSFNIDLDSLKQAIFDIRKSNLNPKAIISVDLFGMPAELDELMDFALENNLLLLSDAAQSFGSKYNDKFACNFGHAATTSFFPAKPFGCYGDGGAIFTNNSEAAELLRSIRLHGKGSEKYDNIRIGINSRLDSLQAAVLLEKIKIFSQEIIRRNEIAIQYNEQLNEFVEVPKLFKNKVSTWAQYTIKTIDQLGLKEFLNNNGIPSVIYYPKTLSQQGGYCHYPKVSSGTVNSREASKTVLSLPMHPYLSDESVAFISSKVKDYLS